MRKRVGFTLIELLVVISIIAILASLLLPALNKARATAQSSSCLNQQRQLVSALFLYTDSYQGWIPGYRAQTKHWPYLLVEASSINDKIFSCPGMKGYGWRNGKGSSDTDLRFGDYGMNYHFLEYGFTSTWFSNPRGAAKLNFFATPSRVIFTGDSYSPRGPNVYTYRMLHMYNIGSNDYGVAWPAHLLRVNISWLDGHVSTCGKPGSGFINSSLNFYEMYKGNNYADYWGRLWK